MAHALLPLEQPIDLLNVAFENPRVVLASKQAPKQKKVRTRKVKGKGNSGDQEVASEEVLLAPLQDLELEEISAPEAPVVEVSPFELCPDRLTGRAAAEELRSICPGRTWNFVVVNVPYSEFLEHRQKVISLIYPHNTEMDLSIACALYFAARGQGFASTSDDGPSVDYTTPARVLLSGLGADELFGGYTRHATAFERRGFEGLTEELELDVNRLGKRNLGRDDRAISDWGREVRFPYLDEELVRWSLGVPVWQKCGFGEDAKLEATSLPEIEPGKKVLRLLAHKLGMKQVAQEKKRAVSDG
jgi:hypothetical protein